MDLFESEGTMIDYKLTKDERETVITFDDGSLHAYVYTCNEALKRKMKKLLLDPSCTVECRDQYSETYIIPKSWIRLNKPRQLTEEYKDKRATAMRELNELRRKEGE